VGKRQHRALLTSQICAVQTEEEGEKGKGRGISKERKGGSLVLELLSSPSMCRPAAKEKRKKREAGEEKGRQHGRPPSGLSGTVAGGGGEKG